MSETIEISPSIATFHLYRLRISTVGHFISTAENDPEPLAYPFVESSIAFNGRAIFQRREQKAVIFENRQRDLGQATGNGWRR